MASRALRWLTVGAVVLVASAGACSSDDDDGDESASATSTSSSSSSSSSSSWSSSTSSSSTAAPTSAPTGATTTTSTVATRSPITVAADGFAIGARRYTYAGGSSVATVKDGFRPILGAPQKEADLECDAGSLHQVRWREIDVYFAEGRLAGWALDPRPASPPLRTSNGIGIGSTRPEIERAYPGVQVEETSLGTEWFAPGATPDNGLSGILASPAPDAVNEALWSGRTCVAR